MARPVHSGQKHLQNCGSVSQPIKTPDFLNFFYLLNKKTGAHDPAGIVFDCENGISFPETVRALCMPASSQPRKHTSSTGDL